MRSNSRMRRARFLVLGVLLPFMDNCASCDALRSFGDAIVALRGLGRSSNLEFCWAFADSVLHRLAPLWVGARGLEFTWDYILQGLEANANLGVEYITCSIRLFNLAQEKQAQDFDTNYIRLCWDCGDDAIYYKLSERKLGMGLTESGRIRALHFTGDGFH
ncbi:hypothetical protein OROGR_016480 [Orobanche gracilis]